MKPPRNGYLQRRIHFLLRWYVDNVGTTSAKKSSAQLRWMDDGTMRHKHFGAYTLPATNKFATKKKRPKPRRKCIVFQPLIFRDTLIVLETFLLFLPLFLEVGLSHHIFVKFLASENWGNWCAIIFTYPPGNESISHQTGKGRSKIIDSKVPAGMGYASSQEGML